MPRFNISRKHLLIGSLLMGLLLVALPCLSADSSYTGRYGRQFSGDRTRVLLSTGNQRKAQFIFRQLRGLVADRRNCQQGFHQDPQGQNEGILGESLPSRAQLLRTHCHEMGKPPVKNRQPEQRCHPSVPLARIFRDRRRAGRTASPSTTNSPTICECTVLRTSVITGLPTITNT